jgi:hypothetical protein
VNLLVKELKLIAKMHGEYNKISHTSMSVYNTENRKSRKRCFSQCITRVN